MNSGHGGVYVTDLSIIFVYTDLDLWRPPSEENSVGTKSIKKGFRYKAMIFF